MCAYGQAVRFAIDREAMLEAATGGLGSLGNDTPVGPAGPVGRHRAQLAHSPCSDT